MLDHRPDFDPGELWGRERATRARRPGGRGRGNGRGRERGHGRSGGASGQGVGGSNVAGAAGTVGATGGSSATGGSAGGAGFGGGNPLLGIDCADARCEPGQACVVCSPDDGTPGAQRCVPHPVQDPAGYAAATAGCRPTSIYNDCDGPEDCAPEEFCVAREEQDGFIRCRTMPANTSFCCFSCGAPTDCTLCRTTDDCPDEQTCQPVETGLMGCW